MHPISLQIVALITDALSITHATDLVQFPITVVLSLTVPVVDTAEDDHNWNKWLNVFHVVSGPVCITLVTRRQFNVYLTCTLLEDECFQQTKLLHVGDKNTTFCSGDVPCNVVILCDLQITLFHGRSPKTLSACKLKAVCIHYSSIYICGPGRLDNSHV